MAENSSGNASSQGSNPSLLKVVEQLIESDEQEKNNKKITALKKQFPVLKRIYPFSTNQQKLQIFLHDQHFKSRVSNDLYSNGMIINQHPPIIKAYLVSTRYGVQVIQQFDQNDVFIAFQRFGQIYQCQINHQFAYIWFNASISSYLAVKTLNGLEINEWLRLCTKFCNEEEIIEAYSLFSSRKNCRNSPIYQQTLPLMSSHKKPQKNHHKYIIKYELGMDDLPDFNLAQRLIGPRGSYMKKVIQKAIANQTKYTMQNIDSVLKIRFIPRNTSVETADQQGYQERSHIFISSKQKGFYENSCRQIELLLKNVVQQYKINFQRLYKRHAEGVAYTVFYLENIEFVEVKHVNLQEIENTVDLVNLSKQPKLSPKIIQEKIFERQRARKLGKFQQADKIRNWLRTRGVSIIDSKGRGQKSTWNYLM